MLTSIFGSVKVVNAIYVNENQPIKNTSDSNSSMDNIIL